MQAALLYVDCNPVRAAMTGEATAWPWSSADAHVGGDDRTGLLAAPALETAGGCQDWAARLRPPVEASQAERLRESTRSGLPFASPEFIEKLEARLGRRLRPRPMRRPKKKAAAANATA